MEATQLTGARVAAQDLTEFCIEAMRVSGLNEEDARLTAEVLVTTDTLGTFTHGTRQLRGLLRNLRTGRLSATAHEEIAAEGPAWAIVDAHYAMPPAVSYRSMLLAMRKAQACGIGYVGVRHSSHYGAAGFYANLAARHDMFGLSMCNVDPCMTVPGSKGKVLGTNPIAFAAPAGEEKPVYLDIATSAVAATKIHAAKALGKPIPDNWLVDEDGLPTSDLSQYPHKARAGAHGRAQRLWAGRHGRNPDGSPHRRGSDERGEQLGAGLAGPHQRRPRLHRHGHWPDDAARRVQGPDGRHDPRDQGRAAGERRRPHLPARRDRAGKAGRGAGRGHPPAAGRGRQLARAGGGCGAGAGTLFKV